MSEYKFYPEIYELPYLASDRHRLFFAQRFNDNIGEEGDNLTISIISYNRANLTIKLMDSIEEHFPHFKGEFLIIDNASMREELDKLYEAVKKYTYRSRIVELDKNYGVSGGRNRTVPHVTTEWVMMLDNDMYFTQNPLPTYQKDMALLGCHFFNLSHIENNETHCGKHLYIGYYGEDINVGCGLGIRSESVTQLKPMLTTFLAGTASIMNVNSFKSVGGFDEGYFIGFEDLDFSLRLFQAGYKIGNASVAALVHEHPVSTVNNYDQLRYKREILEKAGNHFYEKFGMRVWNAGVEEWLKEKNKEMGVHEEEAEVTKQAPALNLNAKPQIALVIDLENWAYHNIAKQLTLVLGDKYDFTICNEIWLQDMPKLHLMHKDKDLIHYFWRPHIFHIFSDHYRKKYESIGINYDCFLNEFYYVRRRSTAVYDHLFETDYEYTRGLLVHADAYYTASKRLFESYSRMGKNGIPKPLMSLPDGVSPELFPAQNRNRFDNNSAADELIVGWTGNSKWGMWDGGEDKKGFFTIVSPVIEELQKEGYNIKTCYVDKTDNVPHSRMHEYYNRMHVYVCASLIEGTPNPVLEAMCCGVPVISTDVGIVPEVFGPRQKEFIIKRNRESLKKALIRLIKDRKLLPALSKENLEYIKPWYWSIRAKNFAQFFDHCLSINK